MLNKLLKYDLKRCFSWFWILSLVTLACAGLTRLINLGSGSFIVFFSGLLNVITITLIANVVLQPFLRIFINLQKDVYGDEGYLTHTLPVTKNQILFSRLLSALIQIVVALIVLVLSFFVLYWTPELGVNFLTLINLAISNVVANASISAGGLLTILVILAFIVILAVIASGFTAVIFSNEKVKNKKSLFAVLIALALMYLQNILAGVISVGIAVAFGADINAELIPQTALIAFLITYIIINIIYIVAHILVSKRQFNKGVNID